MRKSAVDYFKAAEGWSLPASAMSVISVTCYLVYFTSTLNPEPSTLNPQPSTLNLLNAFLALIMMMLFQAGSSTLSDCSDHLHGVDRPDDPKVTWIYSGLFTIAALRRYAALLLGLGSLAGLTILMRGNWDAIWLGFAGLALGIGYSFLKYHALGDLAIFLAFALLPALGVGRVVAEAYLPVTMLVVLPVGLITVAIVHANNWRDIESDRAAGIKTLPILIGARASAVIYALEILLPYVLVAALVLTKVLPPTTLSVFATLPLAIKNLKPAHQPPAANHQPPAANHQPLTANHLSHLDRSTALLQLAFGSVYSLSMLLHRLAADM